MKRLVLVLVMVGCLTGLAIAGEKEELQLKSALLQTEIARLQTFQQLIPYKLKEAQENLLWIEKRLKELEQLPTEGSKK